MTAADAVIEMLADEGAALREANTQLTSLIVNLDADVAVYRELMQASFDALREVTVRLQHVSEERDRLREENRALLDERFLRLDVEQFDEVSV